MTPLLAEALARIAAIGRVDTAGRPEIREVCDRLFDLGLVNIAPPGWAFKVNDAGRAVLAAIEAAKPKWQRRARRRVVAVPVHARQQTRAAA